ncbi:Protein of unknown function [Pyronema omphalodes CBS 100304]|uniref:Uncharacterized protein n=1 Tax=Pyronema omphalodes (strain CBS 100304) TaxID=1076935 RepID=U4L0C9_PYROM|nr:Protein of unknown function [Pyronema omphalodes CBS 100304]
MRSSLRKIGRQCNNSNKITLTVEFLLCGLHINLSLEMMSMWQKMLNPLGSTSLGCFVDTWTLLFMNLERARVENFQKRNGIPYTTKMPLCTVSMANAFPP